MAKRAEPPGGVLGAHQGDAATPRTDYVARTRRDPPSRTMSWVCTGVAITRLEAGDAFTLDPKSPHTFHTPGPGTTIARRMAAVAPADLKQDGS